MSLFAICYGQTIDILFTVNRRRGTYSGSCIAVALSGFGNGRDSSERKTGHGRPLIAGQQIHIGCPTLGGLRSVRATGPAAPRFAGFEAVGTTGLDSMF